MAEADEAARVCWILKLNPELLDEAVHLSAVMGAKTPAAYISTLLRDWHFAGVQNAADLGRYQFNNDVIRGRITGDSSQALSDNQAIREAARGAHAYG